MSNIISNIWNWINEIGKFIVKNILNIFGMEISDDKWNSFIQFVKFGLVGVSNTIISYVVYAVAVKAGVYYLVGNLLGFVVSVLNSFYWNNNYVFKKEEGACRSWIRTLVKTFISYGVTGLLLSTVLLYLWIDILGISQYIAPIINLLVTIPLNFILNKLWAFKTSIQEHEGKE